MLDCIVGSIPSAWGSESISNISIMILRANSLTGKQVYCVVIDMYFRCYGLFLSLGSIPVSFALYPKLEYLYLHYNLLTGEHQIYFVVFSVSFMVMVLLQAIYRIFGVPCLL